MSLWNWHVDEENGWHEDQTWVIVAIILVILAILTYCFHTILRPGKE